MSYYWIKLYHEIIDDPKMATLPDNLWRRVIELFLLAGRHNQGGCIPDSKGIAWELRMSQDDVDIELKELERVGIISQNDAGWFVNQFATRQAARGDVERQRDHRDATKRNQYNNAGVTSASRSVTQITDIESDTDKNRVEAEPQRPNIFKVYEQNIGGLSPIITNELIEAESKHGEARVTEAITEAVKSNVRRWSYVKAILDKKRDTRGNGKVNPDDPDYRASFAGGSLSEFIEH